MNDTASQTTTETKPTKKKAPMKTARAKAAAPKTKPAKPKKEKVPKEKLCTFAIRLRPAQRDEIHQAAGPRNATQFVLAVALAAARNDDSAYREAIETARKLQ